MLLADLLLWKRHERGMAKKQRSDADRRVRQCERLGRLLRLLHLIMGKGRWDAGTLAEELECSRRTVYRLLQTLSLAGVPWYFDETCRAYRIRPGFKFPGLEQTAHSKLEVPTAATELEPAVRKLISDLDAFAASLHGLLSALQKRSGDL
jgi:predicted DNA-binding transcriptional regulator YafY